MAVIEAFADIWCPFAHAGLRALVARRAELGHDDVPLRIRAWPLELVNGKPEDPSVTASHVADLRKQVAPDLFTGFDPDHFPATSIPALTLAAAAYVVGDRVGEQVSLALRDALWERGFDIADLAVLQAIAEEHDVGAWSPADDSAVRAEWQEGQARGVQGSPHFFCGDTSAFCPSLDIEDEGDGRLTIEPDPAALDAFLATGLA